MNTSLLDALLEREKELWAAAGDARFYRERLTENAVMAMPFGFGLMDREQVVDAIERGGEPWSRFEFDDIRLVELTDDAAVLAYRASAWRVESKPPYQAVICSVYVRRGGGWALAFHQQTPEP